MAPPVYTARVTGAFARFFAAYPWREVNPRARALKAFDQLVTGEKMDPEALIGAAGRFAQVVKAQRIKTIFVPHAATWLNQRDFEDYLEADAPASAGCAQPTPDHPLDWMRADMAEASWTAWISRLVVVEVESGVQITAPSSFVLDRVRNEHGRRLKQRYGAITWQTKGPTP